MHRRAFIALAGSTLAAYPAVAAPRKYLLDRENSVVGFTYQMNGSPVTGRMPVKSADIVLDVDRPSTSKVSAEINAARANAGLFFATEAMKSRSVLNTSRFPTIRFQSVKITGTVRSARMIGQLTVRDITEEIALDTVLYRQRGTEEGDRRKLSILMTAQIDRRRFGAAGFPSIVAPMIRLQILTRITLA